MIERYKRWLKKAKRKTPRNPEAFSASIFDRALRVRGALKINYSAIVPSPDEIF